MMKSILKYEGIKKGPKYFRAFLLQNGYGEENARIRPRYSIRVNLQEVAFVFSPQTSQIKRHTDFADLSVQEKQWLHRFCIYPRDLQVFDQRKSAGNCICIFLSLPYDFIYPNKNSISSLESVFTNPASS